MKNYAIIDILNFIINQLAEVPGVAQVTHWNSHRLHVHCAA